MNADLQEVSRRHANLIQRAEQLEKNDPTSGVARSIRLEANDTVNEIRLHIPEGDWQFRIGAAIGGVVEQRMPTSDELVLRSIGATARATVGDKSFSETFMAAAVKASPLMRLALQIPLHGVYEHDFSSVITAAAAGDVVADGAAMTSGDPTFGVAHQMFPFAYKRLLKISNEVTIDSKFNLEQFVADTLAPLIASDFEDDAWGGAGGTTAPQGLLSTLATTTAASASTVVIDDVAAVLLGLGDTVLSEGNISILCNPTAWFQLRRQGLGTTFAGGQAIPANAGFQLFGYPVFLSAGLAAPSTGVKPIVVGNFGKAYAVGQMPLRVEFVAQTDMATDQNSMRVVMRADGRVMDTAHARALVMA